VGVLAQFAQRSPVHAFGVWLFKSTLILLVGFLVWLVVSNVLVPNLVDQFVQQVQRTAG
jgi:hypothetical protein